jgi:hypothetical protein
MTMKFRRSFASGAICLVMMLTTCIVSSGRVNAASSIQTPRSTSAVLVDGTKYLFNDCNAVDWCWQPRGTYTNVGKKGTITYLEVVYTISALGKSLKFVEKLKTSIRPGKQARILSGKNNRSFVLSFYSDAGSTIGPLLGSTYVKWYADVRYVKFSDGSSAGVRVNN